MIGLDVTEAMIEQGKRFIEWMDFSLTEKEHREEILRAVRAELNGGPKTGLSPYEEDSVLCFKQLDLSILGRKLP